MLKSINVCDRCGSPFKDISERDVFVKKVVRNKNGVTYRNESIDLCPQCYEALYKFIFGDSCEK